MTSTSPRRLTSPRTMLALLASACLAVVLLDVLMLAGAVVSTDLQVSSEVIAVEAVAMATGVAILAAVRYLSAHSNGRRTGVLLVGAGAVTGIFVPVLAALWPIMPVCDLGTGDSCALGPAEAPPWYVLARGLFIVAASVSVVALLALTGGLEARQRLCGDRATTDRTTRPAAVVLSWCITGSLVTCAVNVVAVRQRLASAPTGEPLFASAAAAAYNAAAWLTGSALVLAAAATLVAIAAWRGRTRPAGHVRTFGGLVCTGQLVWAAIALVSNPPAWSGDAGKLDGIASELPAWYPPTLATLLVSVALAALIGLASLAVAASPSRT